MVFKSEHLTLMTAIVVATLFAGECVADTVKATGTIEAVDANARTITVTRATPSGEKSGSFEVSNDAEITVGNVKSRLDSLKIGQTAALTYDTSRRMVTKIEADGVPAQRLVFIRELSSASPDFAPWMSSDGSTIYWSRDESIWVARRTTVHDQFQQQTKLFDGFMPTVTADGLYMVLSRDVTIGSRELGRRLFVATRPAMQDRFRPPKEIRELREMGILMAPCLSPDGLTLYLTCYGPSDAQKGHWVVTRPTRSSKWRIAQKSRILRHPSPVPSTTPFVSADGLSLFVTNRSRSVQGRFGELLLWSRRSTEDVFSTLRMQVEVDGEPVIGRFPRFSRSTGELFFSAPVSGSSDSEGLWVVRNFVVPEND